MGNVGTLANTAVLGSLVKLGTDGELMLAAGLPLESALSNVTPYFRNSRWRLLIAIHSAASQATQPESNSSRQVWRTGSFTALPICTYEAVYHALGQFLVSIYLALATRILSWDASDNRTHASFYLQEAQQ